MIPNNIIYYVDNLQPKNFSHLIKSKYSLQKVVNITIDLSKESIKNESNQVQHNTISLNNKVCKFFASAKYKVFEVERSYTFEC